MKRNLVALALAGFAGMLSFTAHASEGKPLTPEERALVVAAQNCDGKPDTPYMSAKARRDLQLLVSVEAGWSPEVVRAVHMR